MFETELYKQENRELSYIIDFPDGFDNRKKYPVLFYFHGMGMVRNGIQNVIDCVPVRRERMADDMPFIIVAPYCENFTWIECFETLTAFVDYIINKDYADKNRIYITGSSMGGYTCWALSVMFPEKFAAGVICCGGGMYFAADRIKFPVWAFHGQLDTVVLPRESEIMAEKINATGGSAKLTLVDDCGHGVWHIAFKSKDTYYWLLSKSKNICEDEKSRE